MSVPTKPHSNPSADLLQETRQQLHPHCFAGKPVTEGGLGAEFSVQSDGKLRGVFPCDERFESYPGVIHGGVVSTVLDAAMTNCLFSRGIHAMTGELTVRFHESVKTSEPAIIAAELESARGSLCLLKAELRQGGQVKVTATAKFMKTRYESS